MRAIHPPPLFRPGLNCWRIGRAERVALVIDGANYYRALHEAISRARRSVFVLGWDIDGRIELLRGAEARLSPAPARFFDLVCERARANPQLRFYLNRWDYSFYQASEREGLSRFRWHLAPPNVRYALDSAHPFGACHHQKLVLIDDALAFIGGMDVALERWDSRCHLPRHPHRIDPQGIFAPHHDVQILVSGPVVEPLAHLARERWLHATGEQPLPFAPNDTASVWPPSVTPAFAQAHMAIARTVPAIQGREPIREIERLYLDEIAQAERFIYIENQFITRLNIAVALNEQLKKKPQLRVLMVSCGSPKGIMERKALWSGRVQFHDVLMQGGVAPRVALAYPVSGGREVRIHSKVMAVDDRFLHIGSANLNNRSMALDSECDLVLEAQTPQERASIAALRNDLLQEHTGLAPERIETLIREGTPTAAFLANPGRKSLRSVLDEKYRTQSLVRLAIRIADSEHPLLPSIGQQLPAPAAQRLLNATLLATFCGGLLLASDSLEPAALESVWNNLQILTQSLAEE